MGFRQFIQYFLLSVFALILSPLRAAPADSFHVFFQAPGIDKSSGGHFSIDGGSFDSLQDAARFLEKNQNRPGSSSRSYVPNGHEEPMEFIVVVPKGAAAEYVESFVHETKQAFAAQLGEHSNVRVKVSYIDIERTLQDHDSIQAELTEGLARETDATQREAMQTARAISEEEETHFKTWRDTWYGRGFLWLNERNPVNRSKAASIVATLKIGISASTILSRYGLSDLGAGALLMAMVSAQFQTVIDHTQWSTLGIAALSGGTAAAFGYYATEFSQWCQNHKLAFTRRFPWLEKIPGVRFYNNTPEVKSMAINFVRSTGIAYVLRLMAHYSGQVSVKTGETAASPNTWLFLTESLGLTAGELTADAWLDVGLRKLTQKNYTNYAARSYLLWAIGLIDTSMHAFFRAGETATAYMIGGVSASLKGTLYMLGRNLKPLDRKIVVISGQIPRNSTDFDYVVKQYSLTESLNINMESERVQRLGAQSSVADFAAALDMKHLPIQEVAAIRQRFFTNGHNIVHACEALTAPASAP